MTTLPAYSYNGITRPPLIVDGSGHIVLDGAASAFAATYGIRALYMGVPTGTPYPPVTDSVTVPVDTNAAANSVAEGAAVNTVVNVTVAATSSIGNPITYSLTGDTSGGGFKINPTTGVVSVADPSKIDYETAAGHSYNITVAANDGIVTSSQSFAIAVGNVAPTIPTDANAAANSVVEGAVAGTAVGITASSTDVNGPGVTWSLTSDSSGGGFKIDAATGVVSVADASKIDYETSGPSHTYTVTARASDGTASSSQSFTIAVTDAPVSTPTDSNAAANSVAEGAANGTSVGLTALATDPNGPATSYSLIGDSSGGGFTINATTGVVTVADGTKLDYESAPGHAYSVTVQAQVGATTSTQTFAIAVSDVAPSTPADSDATTNLVLEGAANGTTVGITASSSDVNGGTVTYSLTGDTSGGGFTINATTGVITVADATKIDYESAPGHAYTVTAQASDGTLASSQTFTITVADIAPSVPVDANAATNTVAEGAANGSTVGITASSADVNGPAVTYSLTGDTSGGGFTINATTGVITVADASKIDYESAPGHAYSVTARASDGTLSSSQSFTIAVTDVAPSTPVDANAAANTVAEGAANGSTVGVTASSTDVNGPSVTYSLIGDTSGGGFTINATTGVITVADASKIDYETAAGHAYSVTAQASDGTLASSQTFTIAVTDVAPSTPVDSNAASNTIAEGAANGSTVGITASSTDVNGPAVTYSLTGDTSGGGFTINATTGVITVADASKIDYETAAGHAYSVTAQASDGTLTSSQSFTIAVTDVAPSTPVDSNAAANTIAEGAANGSTVGITASSTDVNGPAVTYSLTGDTSGGGFTINATTGVITVADASKIDYETAAGHAYSVTAQASDGTLTSSQSFTIAVTDVAPSTPVDGNAAANTVAEGAANGSTVGVTVSSTDVNGPGVTYSLTGDTSGGGFTINATTGVVTVADATKIDFESSGGSYTVVAQASDGTLTSSQAFVIGVSDVAPSTPVDSNAAANQAGVGAAAGTAVGVTASSTDVNGPAVTYSLTGDTSGGGFTINAATGVVTIADPSKIVYNAADPTFAITVDASDGTLHSQQTFTIDVVLDLPPTITSGHTLAYTENQAATAIDPAITVTDTDTPDLTHATVQITGNYINGQDLLGFANTATITGTFNAATGTLTLTGTDTVANYQAALASVTYANTSEAPSGAPRTITFIANDGILDSTPATATVNVTPVNDAPVVVAGHVLNYTENQAATVFDAAITLSDVDSANLTGATVQITGNYANGQDVLGFVNQNGITGSFNAATGTLTLGGSASVANYQTALDSVTYFNSSDNPSSLPRTVTVIATDGITPSIPVTGTINVTAVNDAPVSTAGGTLNYTENQAATAIDTSITVTDVDNANLASATVQISGNYVNGEDILGFTNQNGITGSFNAATGTMTLTGSSSVANYQAALRSVTYFDNSDNPSGLDRTVSITANDGIANSNISTATIHVTPVNDAPVVTATGALSYTENQPFTAIAPALTITDADTTTLTTASVQISGNYVNGEDLLAFTNTANITGSFNAATGTLTLTGTDTVANYQSALRSVTYSDNSENPSTAARTVTFTADDGQAANHLSAGSNHTINVTAVDDAPVNSGVPANFVVESGFSHALTGLSIADVDAGTANDITTTLTSAAGSVSVAAVVGGAAITGNGSGVVTLTGTIAEINTSLAGTVNYTAADNAGNTTTTLSIATNDHGHTGTGGPLTDTDVVQIGVLPQVWFINGDQSSLDSSAPRGSQTNPYSDIAEFNTASAGANGPGVNDYIYLKAGTYTGPGIDLKDGQTLLGDDQPLSFANPLGGAPIVIETASGTRPVIHVTSGQAIDLGANNTVAGVNIQTDAGTTGLDDGQGAAGNSVGTLNVSHMAISGAGQAVDIDQGGALNVVLDSLSSTGGTSGVQLAGTASSGAGLLSGTFNGGSGAISGSTSAGFLVGDGLGTASSGGTAVITYGGTISANGTARTVDIQDHSTGLVTLSGNLTHTGSGGSAVFLDDNSSSFTFSGASHTLTTGTANAISISDQTGGTVGFSGTLNIDTTSGTGINLGGTSSGTVNFTGGNLTIDTTGGAGFSATGGGTVNVTGTGNHINSGSGTALNISNTTIGASNVTFQDISSSGGSATGIILNTTGSSGGLHVTGSGATVGIGGGGVIANKTGADGSTNNGVGIYLNNTSGVQLNGLQMNDFQNYAILGNAVNGFTLDHTIVNGTNGTSQGGVGEGDVYFTGLSGSAAVSNSTFTGAAYDGFHVFNNGETLNRLTITNSTFAVTNTGGNDALVFQATGGTFNATVQSSTISAARGDLFQLNLLGTVSSDLVFGGATPALGNTLTNNNANIVSGGGGVTIGGGGASNNVTLTYDISHNSFKGSHGAVLAVTKGTGSSGSFIGTIDSNTIGTQGVAGSGSTQGDGIAVFQDGAGLSNTTITNNHISGVVGGIHTLLRNGAGGQMSAVIQGNTIDTLDQVNGFSGIYAQTGSATGAGGDNNRSNLTIGGAGALANHVDLGANAGSALVAGIVLEQEGISRVGLLGSPNYGGTPYNFTAVQNYIAANNTGSFTNAQAVFAFGDPTQPAGGGYFGAAQFLFAATGGVQASSPTPGETHLTQAQLNSVVDAAIAQWAAAGATASQLAALRATTFSVADLAGTTVGEETAPAHITIDIDAAGHGWFVDPTPWDNFEFRHLQNAAGTDLLTDPSNAAAGHLDLLTTVAHEMGHVIGLPDTTEAGTAHGLMYIDLADGERRLPSAADVALAKAAQPEALVAAPHSPSVAAPQSPSVAAPAQPPPAQSSPAYVMASGDSFNFAAFILQQFQLAASHWPAASSNQAGNGPVPTHDAADAVHGWSFLPLPFESILRQHADPSHTGWWT